MVFVNPLPPFEGTDCKPEYLFPPWFQQFNNPKSCLVQNRTVALSRIQNLNDVFIKLKEENVIEVIDLFHLFCPDTECTYFSKDGSILYRDKYRHPSVEAARLTAPYIKNILKKM